jgi:eukaryotic-like serine/threonine-protein kinase
MKLLSKRPDDRYASAEDLRADLHRFLSGNQTIAERDGFLVGAATGVMAGYGGDAATTVQPATVVGGTPIGSEEYVEEELEPERSRTALFLVLLVLLLAALGGLLYWFAQSLDEGDLVAVPAVVGLTLEEATDRLEDAGLVPEVTREPSTEIEAGRVISQDPGRDEEVEAGSTVELVVSSGVEQIEVPSVIDLPQADAERILTEAGLRVRVETVENDDVDPGLVVEQRPAPDTPVDPDTEVTIVVSAGVGEAIVPNVVGQPLAQAQAAVQAAGFRFGNPVEEASNTVPAGSVISTDPEPGTSLARNSVIRMVVSSGRAQAEVPTVTGQSETRATSTLEDRGFDVEVRPEAVPAGDVTAGRVIRQDPQGGARVEAGSRVIIVVGVEAATTTTTTTTTTTPPED